MIFIGPCFMLAGLWVIVWAVQRYVASDTYEPAAAEAPDPVAERYDEQGDTFGWRRARPWTGTEEAALASTGAPPAVTADAVFDVSWLIHECQIAYERRHSVDYTVGAPHEPSPEVQR